jgi:hypothetical protein
MNKTEFTIWISGFYEGEGTICVDINNNNNIRLCIYQNENCFEQAKEIWGGNIRKRTRKSPVSDKICTNYEWRLTRKNDTAKFIEDIKPYMRIKYKIEQMNNAIEKSKQKVDKRFKCNYCDKDYANPSGRRRHEKKEHSNLT